MFDYQVGSVTYSTLDLVIIIINKLGSQKPQDLEPFRNISAITNKLDKNRNLLNQLVAVSIGIEKLQDSTLNLFATATSTRL